MEIDTLNISSRSETGKGPNRRLRAQGQVPAVIYGTEQEPVLVALNFRQLERALSKPNAETNLFNLIGEGFDSNTTAVIREIQRDPVTRRYLHIDLFRVRMDQEAEFEVPIYGIGNPIGVREGGMMETHLRAIIVKCLPTALPESIEIDISGLQVNQTCHVSDLKLPEGLTLVTDPAETLFGVHPVKVAAETTEEDENQPEVVGKKKEEE